MTLKAFFLILLSLLAHVSWNLLSKKTSPSVAFFLFMNAVGAVVLLPFLFLSGICTAHLPLAFWQLLLVSALAEALAAFAQAHGYKKADISFFYPTVRSLPVAMLAIASLFLPLGRARPSAYAFAGMLLVTVSVLTMGLRLRKSPSEPASCRATPYVWFLVLLGAGSIALYSACDNVSLRLLKESTPGTICMTMGCFCLIESVMCLPLLVHVLLAPTERQECCRLLRHPLYALVAGTASVVGYSFVLIAYQEVDNAPLIFAFRQLSLPLGFLAGVLLLHEKATLQKIIGIIGIVVGLTMTAF